MSKAYIEYRTLEDSGLLAQDIAHHMYTRHSINKAVVITQNPEELQLLLYKQWVKIMQRLQDERSLSPTTARMITLSRHIARMQRLQFTTELPSDRPQADIFLITAASLDDLLPSFNTLYITCLAPHDLLGRVVDCKPEHSVVVAY